MRHYYTYILTNVHHTVLYVGMSNNPKRRADEHFKPGHYCFTARFRVNKLVYYEVFETPMEAIRREKQLKAGPRAQKLRLVEGMNPRWNDLYAIL
ncbi:MAG: GIY-YIG nuclease family protein [Gemmatimonadota bacterium]